MCSVQGSGQERAQSPEVCFVRKVLSVLAHALCRSLSIRLYHWPTDAGTSEHGVTSGRCNGVVMQVWDASFKQIYYLH